MYYVHIAPGLILSVQLFIEFPFYFIFTENILHGVSLFSTLKKKNITFWSCTK